MEMSEKRMQEIKSTIENGKTSLGIEFGSTRIKAVLVDESFAPVASGAHDWENKLENGIWTYSLDDVKQGLQASYAALCQDVRKKYGLGIKRLGALGISAMMHGYLVFDESGKQLVAFRTWRNTITEQAAEALSAEFSFNIPQRWSIAHLYQAILNKEEHVGKIDFLTTLAGYVHWQLTGEKVLGVGEASGVFPIDEKTNNYSAEMLASFNSLSKQQGFEKPLEAIIPTVLDAGEKAGVLSEKGAKLLDVSGELEAGALLCPPEGDAGTGMVATNSVRPRTGNVSAGTSIFAMLVLEKALSKRHSQIDIVATPAGSPVAMVHCNNCTTELDAWVRLFAQTLDTFGAKVEKPKLYDELYFKALEGEADCGGLLAYNYHSGEHVTGFAEGRPLFVRQPQSNFNLANFMRNQLFSILGTIRIGMDILTSEENVSVEKLLGHGGFFKTKGVGQQLMAGAFNVPVAVMASAGEGGAWGIALLAAYMQHSVAGQQSGTTKEKLEDFLDRHVFNDAELSTVCPRQEDVNGFNAYMQNYKKGLEIERAAVESFN